MNNRILASLCVLCTILCAFHRASAQGPLTPPGAPAPTMLTLSQVEPRTPITNTTAVTISTPGSYYLTANISITNGSAITITANQVTLDLNGFTLSSTEASPTGTGILLAGGNVNITILNGHIKGGVTYSGGNYTGSGFANGIYYSGFIPANIRVSGVSVSGCLLYGIYLGTGNSTVVESCTAQTIGSYGIYANSVARSSAVQCGIVAVFASTASDCYASGTGGQVLVANIANNCIGFCTTASGTGMQASTANNCFGQSSGSGPALSATTANNCQGQNFGSGDGLDAVAANNCQGQSAGSGTGLNASQIATGCYGYSLNGDGLDAVTANNCQGVSTGSGIGLNASQTATGCYGTSATGPAGLSAFAANNCTGQSNGSGNGLNAIVANNCTGLTAGNGFGFGLYAQYTATSCYGICTNGGTGLQTGIAIGCYGQSSIVDGFTYNGLIAQIANSCIATPIYSAVYKYNMP